MDVNNFAIPELQTVFSKENGGVVQGWLRDEQQMSDTNTASRGALPVLQFSIINTYDVSKGDFLISDNKRYEVVKIFKNLTHKDLSLKLTN